MTDWRKAAVDLWGSILGGFGTLRERPTRIIEARQVAVDSAGQTEPGVSFPGDFIAGDHYFAAHINEMFLRNEGEWLKQYSPIVLVVSEHTYGGEKVVVPTVVGPSLVNKYIEDLPEPMTFSDTRVAGIHPYLGGGFALTVVLARVQNTDYAQRFLSFLETTAGAIGKDGAVALGVEGYSKVANAVLTGVDQLFGLRETQPIMGQRISFDDNYAAYLKPGHYALINEDQDRIDWKKLSVRNGRLHKGNDRYRDHDHILISLGAADSRRDFEQLAVWKPFAEVENAALSPEADGFEKAKSMMYALSQQVIHSPDLTRKQALSLLGTMRTRLLELKQERQAIQVLSGAPEKAKGVGPGRELLAGAAGGDVDGRIADMQAAADLLSI
jgi:hypothetical protein